MAGDSPLVDGLRRLTGLALARNLMRDDEGRMNYKRVMDLYNNAYSSMAKNGPEIRVCVWLSTTKVCFS